MKIHLIHLGMANAQFIIFVSYALVCDRATRVTRLIPYESRSKAVQTIFSLKNYFVQLLSHLAQRFLLENFVSFTPPVNFQLASRQSLRKRNGLGEGVVWVQSTAAAFLTDKERVLLCTRVWKSYPRDVYGRPVLHSY